jgi:hypothetical protein
MTAIDIEADAFLADSAEAINGKLYAMGIGWNTIWAPAFPVTYPRLALGITIHVPFTATNAPHRFTLHLEDPDGSRLILARMPLPDGSVDDVHEVGGEFNVGRPPLLPAGDEQVVSFAVTLDQITFPEPLLLHWVVTVDGEELKKLTMRVAPLQNGVRT